MAAMAGTWPRAPRRKGFPAQIAWTEYDDWPRGRVVYQKPTQLFVLYADRRLQKPAIIPVVSG
jgi:hypothetical protein